MVTVAHTYIFFLICISNNIILLINTYLIFYKNMFLLHGIYLYLLIFFFKRVVLTHLPNFFSFFSPTNITRKKMNCFYRMVRLPRISNTVTSMANLLLGKRTRGVTCSRNKKPITIPEAMYYYLLFANNSKPFVLCSSSYNIVIYCAKMTFHQVK